jgi:hypothetical protein
VKRLERGHQAFRGKKELNMNSIAQNNSEYKPGEVIKFRTSPRGKVRQGMVLDDHILVAYSVPKKRNYSYRGTGFRNREITEKQYVSTSTRFALLEKIQVIKE